MHQSLVRSAHDCSDGGLATSLAESCFGSDSGAEVEIDSLWEDCQDLDSWGALFGESLGRILVSVRQRDRPAFEQAMAGHACHYLGTVSDGDNISFSRNGELILSASMTDLRAAWKGALDGGAV
jgi:phosphoribosylformylglycinamidine synthase